MQGGSQLTLRVVVKNSVCWRYYTMAQGVQWPVPWNEMVHIDCEIVVWHGSTIGENGVDIIATN
jgi:hypothetical protein